MRNFLLSIFSLVSAINFSDKIIIPPNEYYQILEDADTEERVITLTYNNITAPKNVEIYLSPYNIKCQDDKVNYLEYNTKSITCYQKELLLRTKSCLYFHNNNTVDISLYYDINYNVEYTQNFFLQFLEYFIFNVIIFATIFGLYFIVRKCKRKKGRDFVPLPLEDI